MKLKLICLLFVLSISSFCSNSDSRDPCAESIPSPFFGALTVEDIFFGDYPEALEALYVTESRQIIELKAKTIFHIFTHLAGNAFCKSDPFSETAMHAFLSYYYGFLLYSYNGNDLCERFKHVFDRHGYVMSHFKLNEISYVASNSATKKPFAKVDFISKGNHAICIVEFNNFSFDAYSIVYNDIVYALENNVNIVINLANNSGGLIRVLKQFLSLFVAPGTAVGLEAQKAVVKKLYGYSSHSYNGKEIFDRALEDPSLSEYFLRTSYDENFNPDFHAKIAVIISAQSYSAAESCAKILADHGATLMGKPTTGYALICRKFAVNGESASRSKGLQLTFPIGELIFPDGTCLEGRGLTPELDIEKLGFDKCIDKWLEVSQK